MFLPAEGSALGGSWVREWVEEVVGFPALPHDDRVDACVMGLQRLSRRVEAAHAYTPAAGEEWGRVAR